MNSRATRVDRFLNFFFVVSGLLGVCAVVAGQPSGKPGEWPTYGGDEVAALRGESFLANWSGLPLSELFERIRISMPADNPGKLSRQQNADILAYILKFDTYPAGSSELPTQSEALQRIRFERSNP